MLFVGAAAVAAVAFFSAAHPALVATGVGSHSSIVADGDDNFVNDNGQDLGRYLPAERPEPGQLEM